MGFDYNSVSQLMSNPNFMNMATKLMQDPGFNEYMKTMMSAAPGLAGAGGGMPDMSQLASMMGGAGGGMPDMSQLAGMMGGAGGAGGGMPGFGGFDPSVLENLKNSPVSSACSF